MAKATISLKSGASVTLEGSEEEVATLIARLDGSYDTPDRGATSRRDGKSRVTPKGLISELMDQGFFSTPKGLGEVKAALEESGHFYPVTSLSPLMLRLVRQRELRRLKEKNRWAYVG